MEGRCSKCNISPWYFLVDHCYTTTLRFCHHRINCWQSGLSQTIQPTLGASLENMIIIAMCMGHSLKGYCCLWRRMEISLSESTGWSWLLWMYQTNSTDSIRHQSLKLGLWSRVFKAKQLIRDFIDLQRVLIINCQPQTVQAAICHLILDGVVERLWCFRQHRWADLQWLSTIGSLPLPPNSCPMMSASWSSNVASYMFLRWILDNVVHSYELSFLQDW